MSEEYIITDFIKLCNDIGRCEDLHEKNIILDLKCFKSKDIRSLDDEYLIFIDYHIMFNEIYGNKKIREFFSKIKKLKIEYKYIDYNDHKNILNIEKHIITKIISLCENLNKLILENFSTLECLELLTDKCKTIKILNAKVIDITYTFEHVMFVSINYDYIDGNIDYVKNINNMFPKATIKYNIFSDTLIELM